MRAIRPQRIPSTDSQHHLSRRSCTNRVQLEEELKLRARPDEAYAEELVKLTVRTLVLNFMQEQLSSDTQDEVFTSSWIKKLEELVGDARYRAQHRCHVVELVWRGLVEHATTVSAGISAL